MKKVDTVLHKVFDVAPENDPFIVRAKRSAHYVIDQVLMAAITPDVLKHTLNALYICGVAHLPHDEMVMEFTTPEIKIVALLWKNHQQSTPEVSAYTSNVAVLTGEDVVYCSQKAVLVRLEEKDGVVGLSATDEEGRAPDYHKRVAIVAYGAALVALNAKGAALETVPSKTFAKLNKTRQRRGKHPVPEYTRVRVGTIYNKDGEGQNAATGGRTMPVHIRAGHPRNQAHGPGRKERKLVYIAPTIVNYAGNEHVTPQVPRRVVAL